MKGDTQEVAKVIGVIIVTILTAVIAIWWLYMVAARIGMQPVVNPSGAVVLERTRPGQGHPARGSAAVHRNTSLLGRAKGTSEAKEETAEAKKQTERMQDQLKAVVDVSDKGILKNAMDAFPDAFSQ